MIRRSITTRFTLLTPNLCPLYTHTFLSKDDEKSQPHVTNPIQPASKDCPSYKFNNYGSSYGLCFLLRDRKGRPTSVAPGLGSSFWGYSSSAIGESSNNIEYMNDVAGVLTDKSTELVVTQAPVVNEVAIAAGDSAYPVAFLQYFIDGVHSLTGFNWWASIMLTTIFIRTATIPLLINTLKATTKLSILRPQMEEIRQQMLDSMDPTNVAEGQKKMKLLLNQHRVSPFSPLKGLFIQGPIFVSFYLAITNMVEKVPSFKTGGTLWFSDLTTVDSFYIFPVLTALSFLITVELNAQEGMEGNPVAGTVKTFSRVLAFLTVPFTMNFPKAIFCYWITSNMFSLCYGLVIKHPSVKRFLDIPEIVAHPKGPTPPSIPFFGGPTSVIGRAKALLEQSKTSTPTASPSADQQQPKLPARRVSASSSSQSISQRVRNLERKLKGRKKKK